VGVGFQLRGGRGEKVSARYKRQRGTPTPHEPRLRQRNGKKGRVRVDKERVTGAMWVEKKRNPKTRGTGGALY